jgi:hypothetical protein
VNYKPDNSLTPEAPLYFKFSYGGPDDQPGPQPSFVFDVRTAILTEPIIIYGYTIRSQYSEDDEIGLEAWAHRRAFFTNSFSVLCPEGELGFQYLDDRVKEITQQEFEEAEGALWEVHDGRDQAEV